MRALYLRYYELSLTIYFHLSKTTWLPQKQKSGTGVEMFRDRVLTGLGKGRDHVQGLMGRQAQETPAGSS